LEHFLRKIMNSIILADWILLPPSQKEKPKEKTWNYFEAMLVEHSTRAAFVFVCHHFHHHHPSFPTFRPFLIRKFTLKKPLIFHLISARKLRKSRWQFILRKRNEKSEKVFCTIFSLCRALIESGRKIFRVEIS
jgi:hypothetical protein